MEPAHLTAWDVTDFIEGELEPGRLDWVWEHLDGCEECVRYVAAVLAADAPATAEELAWRESARLLGGRFCGGFARDCKLAATPLRGAGVH